MSSTEYIPLCKNELHTAALYTEMAAKDLMYDEVFLAQQRLEWVIHSLGYTAVEDCKHANDILLAKNELQKIYDANL